MENKKGMINSFIQDTLKSMSADSEQKPVNIITSDKTRFDEKVDNMQRGYLDFNSDLIYDKKGRIEMSGTAKISPTFIDYIKWFSELSNKDIAIAGGKGASLGEMFNNKFPVPPGFVVTAQSFGYFIDKSNIKEKISEILSKIDYEDTMDLNKASAEIRKMIENSEIPADLKKEILESYHILGSEKLEDYGISEDALTILKNSQEPIFVSVRSSATTEDLADASFAGQQESFLNVKGDGQLIEKIKRCFSSLYTPRAIYYRHKKGFKEGEALLAVVVQKMVDSEKSGVVFSKNPVGDEEDIVIEAVFGLGEGIVSGKIKPDYYLVSKDLEIKNIKTADKKIAIVRTGSGDNEIVRLSPEKSKSQVLSRGEIKEIANYAVKLEEHYKKPQDIEFAFESGTLYILQSRPVTTLGKGKGQAGEIHGDIILEGQSASPGIGTGIVKIVKSMDDLPKIKKGDVLVTEMTNPDMVVAMQKSSAIVTDEGGMTSHAAIVSREMGIPCIVGTDDATTVLKDGMRITVDGTSGKVYDGEVAETKTVEIKPVVETSKIKLKVIVDLPDFAERAAESGVKNVGLTRLEGIIASMKKHPLWYEKNKKLNEYSEIIANGLGRILKHFNSVWFRASDLRTDEYSSLDGAPEKEINPMLGFHGIRFSLKHPEILKAELEAMKKVASINPDKKIGIMFPQVISIEEVKEAKKYFNKVKLSNMEFGVMIETPASVQIIDDICEEVDFISFGTNDLTQYTLAVDRNNEEVQYLYNEMHPSIFSQIEKVIDAGNSKNVETSICGQAGSKKEMVEFLFKKGIKSISVNADAAADISLLVKNLESDWFKKEEENRLIKEEELKKEKQEIGERKRLEEEKLERERRVDTGRRIEEERIKKERLEEEKLEREKKSFEKIKEENFEGGVVRGNQRGQIESSEKVSGFQKTDILQKTNVENLSNEELKRKLWKLKKQRRWKEFNNLKREMKKKGLWEDGENKKEGWNKKARLGDLKFKDEGNEEGAKVVEREMNKQKTENQSEELEKNKNPTEQAAGDFYAPTGTAPPQQSKLLDIKPSWSNKDNLIEDRLLENKKIEAEMHIGEIEENIGPIEPFGNTERIDDIGNEIQERVHEKNKEELEAEKNIIEVSGEKVNENDGQEGEAESYINSDEEDYSEPLNEDDVDGTDLTEDIGVYNPDEPAEEKKKFKYNFENYDY